MKKFSFLLMFIVFLFNPAFSQTGYLDPNAHLVTLTFSRDSISDTDSSFGKFTLPFNAYYRGMSVECDNGGIGTYKLADMTSQATIVTSIDSCITSAVSAGEVSSFCGLRVNPKTALIGGKTYRIEWISTLLEAIIRPQVIIYLTRD